MNVHDFTAPLEDSIELGVLAVAAGITRVEAKRFLARLAETPIRQAIRLAKTCHAEEQRERDRKARLRR